MVMVLIRGCTHSLPAHCRVTAFWRRAQRKFTDLSGTSEAQGDLKSIVLHKLEMVAQKSSFPVALGIRITGVDDSTFSQTGESYSAVALPNADTHISRTLQEDDTALGTIISNLALDVFLKAMPLCSVRICQKVSGLHR